MIDTIVVRRTGREDRGDGGGIQSQEVPSVRSALVALLGVAIAERHAVAANDNQCNDRGAGATKRDRGAEVARLSQDRIARPLIRERGMSVQGASAIFKLEEVRDLTDAALPIS
jgi:hypothetical protein